MYCNALSDSTRYHRAFEAQCQLLWTDVCVGDPFGPPFPDSASANITDTHQMYEKAYQLMRNFQGYII
jgi:hypothetical protein